MSNSPEPTTNSGGTRGADIHVEPVLMAALACAGSRLNQCDTLFGFHRRVFTIIAMRKALAHGVTLKDVAAGWGIDYSRASKIINRKLWRSHNAAADKIIEEVSARQSSEEPSTEGQQEKGDA